MSDILLVDDEKDVLDTIKTALEGSGFMVHGFTNPEKAVAHIRKGCKHCKILVTDVRMPQMSGFEVARQINNLRPDMKIVIMTAFEMHLSEVQTVLPSVKADDFITKPFPPSRLMRIVRPLCESIIA
jgi:DNA-binding NtrC family response regulator